MPIENIINNQKQSKLFEEELVRKLNCKNKLYQLRDVVDWSALSSKALSSVSIKKLGRNRKDHRVMLALLMLQAMYTARK